MRTLSRYVRLNNFIWEVLIRYISITSPQDIEPRARHRQAIGKPQASHRQAIYRQATGKAPKRAHSLLNIASGFLYSSEVYAKDQTKEEGFVKV